MKGVNDEGRRTTPRRVLLVETTHEGSFGGSHQALYDLARHLDPRRYTPTVLFYEENPFAERLRALGFRVLVWEDQWQREHGIRRRWFSPARVLSMLEAITKRASLLRRERVELLHMNNSPSYGYYDWLPAARLAGVPVITHLRGELYPIRNPVVRWLNHRFERYLTISTYVSGILERERFPSERVRQIEDGIDIETFRGRVSQPPDAVRAALGIGRDVLLATMVGHLRKWKGQDVVLRALAALAPDERARLCVVFAGADDPLDTSYRRELDELVARHGLEHSVRFLGARSDVPDLMNAADLVLHASTTPEPFGLVVLEGMALGRLVIAAALGGPLQIVSDSSGWVFDPSKPEQLAALLRRVLAEPGLCRSFDEPARARAEYFTVQRSARRVQEVYDEVLA